MSRFRVEHATTYTYPAGATLCSNIAHLQLRTTPTQAVRSSEIVIDPVPDDRSDAVDVFGNLRTHFSVERPHDRLVVTGRSVVDLVPPVHSDVHDIAWDDVRRAPLDPVTEVVHRLPSRLVPSLAHVAKFAEPSFTPGRPLRDAVAELTSRIHTEFAYDPTATTVATPLADVVAARRGVCQDFAHLAVGCLRSVGLAARYVSGYLETTPPPGQPKLIGADASHAWASVRCPDGTWLDFDPTNDSVAPADYVTVAWGRDYSDVVPVKGVFLSVGGSTSLAVSVDVARLDPATGERIDGAVAS